jgi:hypothetical protein
MRSATLIFIGIAFLFAIIIPQELYADAAPSGPFLGVFIGVLVVSAVLLGVAVYHIFNAPAQGFAELDFQEEEVVLELEEEQSRVSCTFYIMNKAERSYSGMFYFPFVVDETHPFPEDLYVSYTANGENVEPVFERKDERIFFGLTLMPEERTVLCVSYTQPNLEPKVTYIITSANDWYQPVGKATFEIHHPRTWENVSISYSPQTTIELLDEVVHTIYIEDLAPEHELEISWQPET